jgi:hypothetical protein
MCAYQTVSSGTGLGFWGEGYPFRSPFRGGARGCLDFVRWQVVLIGLRR